MPVWRQFAVVSLCVALFGCSSPESAVRAAFEGMHADAVVKSIRTSEGDRDNAYVTVAYELPLAAELQTARYLAHWDYSTSDWKLTRLK